MEIFEDLRRRTVERRRRKLAAWNRSVTAFKRGLVDGDQTATNRNLGSEYIETIWALPGEFNTPYNVGKGGCA